MERESRSANQTNDYSVKTWLEILGLPEYIHLFGHYKSVEEILNLSELDIRDLGVKNSAHRAKMTSNLVMMRGTKQLQKNQPRMLESTAGSTLSIGTQRQASLLETVRLGSVYQTTSASSSSSPNDCTTTMNSSLTRNLWYHPGISRIEAERLVTAGDDGRFLVRDSSTQLGDLILTTFSKGIPLHFVVNKIVAKEEEEAEKTMYHFEAESFETVTGLVEFYLQNRRPLTTASGAVISRPVVRAALETNGRGDSQRRNRGGNLGNDETGAMHRRAESQPLLTVEERSVANDDDEKKTALERCLMSVARNATSVAVTTTVSRSPQDQSTSMQQRSGSEPSLMAAPSGEHNRLTSSLRRGNGARDRGPENETPKPAPPKPSRVPTVKTRAIEKPVVVRRNQTLYDDDGKDYTDIEQVVSWPYNTKEASSDAGDAKQGQGDKRGQFEGDDFRSRTTISYFDDVAEYENGLLSTDNKPLEPSAFSVMKSLILESDALDLAQHLTLIDVDLMKVAGENDLGSGVTSGLELITLPQGRSLCEDISERYICLWMFVSLTIIQCTSCQERVNMLNQWIQVAFNLRGACGNLFAFSAVMKGLQAEQIKRLEKSWQAFRREHVANASIFASKLSGFLRGLDDAASILPLQNIVVPHVMPLVEMMRVDYGTASSDGGTRFLDEMEALGFSLDSLLAHLDTGRLIVAHCASYRRAAQRATDAVRLERCLLDLMDPRTHAKFLWGARGATAAKAERYTKFEQVLRLLSQRVEPTTIAKD